MNATTFRLVILISMAHALVHVFELSLPSVEQMIGDDFDVAREQTGVLGTVWRVPFGVGAFFAGWLADRFGSKPMLVIYLLGCAATSLLVWTCTSFDTLYVLMFAMGCFASIYHPAGLAFISRETTPETRGVALGWHGIFGSIGIAGAPFLAALVFWTGAVTWQQYYLLLVIPGLGLAAYLFFGLTEHRQPPVTSTANSETGADEGRWGAYLILVAGGAMAGFIYAGFMHFLPRYLNSAELRPSFIEPASFRNFLAAVVLIMGVLGQGIAGKFARPGRLQIQLALIMFANIGPLLWMAVATGPARFAAACLLGLVHFMTQPIYNSLIAQYVPFHRRSVGYGFSNMACFGIGALGPTYAGYAGSDFKVYGGLAIAAAASGMMALVLHFIGKRDSTNG
ncbi:bicyclomycin/multidrug efflux system [Symmachiella dynata]|uniref:Bicyclomycin/multidrug efflux system n=1 Tax=Symmachiella dynata TaxID=2527995 RepID=A0A517ZGU3_9PLAN|nr:MFS transporter [Symmachiella dynata]QDU41698.1 bicyclomycin/multidrug efflux system [Symmachiella dynata]